MGRRNVPNSVATRLLVGSGAISKETVKSKGGTLGRHIHHGIHSLGSRV